jgi:hypothetical protein
VLHLPLLARRPTSTWKGKNLNRRPPQNLLEKRKTYEYGGDEVGRHTTIKLEELPTQRREIIGHGQRRRDQRRRRGKRSRREK